MDSDIERIVNVKIISLLKRMSAEFELIFPDVFNYKDINKYINNLEKDKETFEAFRTKTIKTLERVPEASHNTKRYSYKFLVDIVLFDGLMEFKLLEVETRSTKKTIVEYLRNLKLLFNMTTNEKLLKDYVENELNTKKSSENKKQVCKNKCKNTIKNVDTIDANMINTFMSFASHATSSKGAPSQNLLSSILGGLTNQGDPMALIGSVIQNTDIMKLAEEITQELDPADLSPENLINVITNPSSANSNGLLVKINNKISDKINNGNVDKDALEKQARDIVNTITKK